MNLIKVRNVHRALPLALEMLKMSGVRRESRNGPVLQSPDPVATVYERPLERVMFWPQRDANPFFHFFESLWMLGGRDDVESVSRFASNMTNYSDDGKRFYASYGHRWRVAFGNDQLKVIGQRLKANPEDRRVVLQMWDAGLDLGHTGKDVPCNTTATFQTGIDGRLNLVVFCRSNDVVWGCYGANAVQFSTLLEYVAARAELPVGTYTQISVNWHGYLDTFEPLYERMSQIAEVVLAREMMNNPSIIPNTSLKLNPLIEQGSPYEDVPARDATGTWNGKVPVVGIRPYPLVHGGHENVDQWDASLFRLLKTKGRAPAEGVWNDPFFTDVALPILRAHDIYKEVEGRNRYEKAIECVDHCRAEDWRVACKDWLYRRFAKWQKDQDDGPAA